MVRLIKFILINTFCVFACTSNTTKKNQEDLKHDSSVIISDTSLQLKKECLSTYYTYKFPVDTIDKQKIGFWVDPSSVNEIGPSSFVIVGQDLYLVLIMVILKKLIF